MSIDRGTHKQKLFLVPPCTSPHPYQEKPPPPHPKVHSSISQISSCPPARILPTTPSHNSGPITTTTAIIIIPINPVNSVDFNNCLCHHLMLYLSPWLICSDIYLRLNGPNHVTSKDKKMLPIVCDVLALGQHPSDYRGVFSDSAETNENTPQNQDHEMAQ